MGKKEKFNEGKIATILNLNFWQKILFFLLKIIDNKYYKQCVKRIEFIYKSGYSGHKKPEKISPAKSKITGNRLLLGMSKQEVFDEEGIPVPMQGYSLEERILLGLSKPGTFTGKEKKDWQYTAISFRDPF